MGAHGFLGEALLLFLVLFLPGYLSQPAAASATPADTVRAMLQSVIFGVPQVLLMLHLLRLQPEVPLEHFGLYRPRVRDALRAAGRLPRFPRTGGPVRRRHGAGARAPGAGRRRGTAGASHSGWQLPLALVFGLTAGYREELYFRAYLLGRFEQAGIPRTAGVAASTALFALGHLYEGVLGVALALVMGLYFSLVYLRSRSLHVPAVAHGLFNAALLALSLFAPGLPGAG